jgi:hypothetical protein
MSFSRTCALGLAFSIELMGLIFTWAGIVRRCFASSSLWGKFGGLYACGATFRYIVPLPNIFLTHLLSKFRLKRKDFQVIARLAWVESPRPRKISSACLVRSGLVRSEASGSSAGKSFPEFYCLFFETRAINTSNLDSKSFRMGDSFDFL